MLKILAICAALSGCLYTDVEGDIEITGEPMIRQTCHAEIACAPPITFDWCARFNTHNVDSHAYVLGRWLEYDCEVNDGNRGEVWCDAGGTVCFKHGPIGDE